MTAVPQGKVREVVAMLKAIHAQEDRAEAEVKAAAVNRLREPGLTETSTEQTTAAA